MPDDAVTLGVVVARLDDLRADVKTLRDELLASRRDFVARTEWEMRNQHVDGRFRDQGREIADLRTDIASRRAPWWSIATALAAVGAIALSVVQALAG